MSAAQDKAGRSMLCLRIVELLAPRALDGMSNRELADRLGVSPSTVSRAVADLEAAGWAEHLPTGRYGVTPRLIGVLKAYQLYMADLSARSEEFNQRAEARARQMLAGQQE